MNPLPYLQVLLLGGVIAAASYFLVDYKDMARTRGDLDRKIEQLESRVASYQRMVERRDKAIEASKCKDTIKTWIRKPDDIPVPFDPFNQLK